MPMVMAAGREIVEASFMDTTFGEAHENLTRNASRCLMTLSVFVFAYAVPNFAVVVPLVGGLVNALLGLILPPLLWARYVADGPVLVGGGIASKGGASCFVQGLRQCAYYAVSTLGVLLLVTSTIFTVADMAK